MTLLTILLSTLFIACGGGSSSGGSDASPKNNNIIEEGRFVEAKSISSEFSPDDYQAAVLLEDHVREIHLPSAFSGVRVKLDKKIPLRSFAYRAITVVKNGSRPEVLPSWSQGAIHLSYLRANGSYECSMSSTNGEIGWVEGGCVVSVEVRINPEDKVEVYYQGKRLTKIKFGMDYDTFFAAYDGEFDDKKSYQLLREFVQSYRLTGDKLVLSAQQVDDVLSELNVLNKMRMPALRLTHSYVEDRESLREVVADNFMFDEEEEALRVVGLEPL